ncbi:unnamed protein product [Prorocentrum cordatum]|uniref:Uncharacterized protein n=1 Tax=Prorocentrum cordatum TaxID=2364126 RepID=A0ABN9WD64_9DINO|nr:unnamed protein product [Polarella glacialis]
MGTWPLSCWFKLPQLVATWKSLATPPSASIEMGCCMASYRSQAAEPQLPPHMPELEEVPKTADEQAAEPQMPPSVPEMEEVPVPAEVQAAEPQLPPHMPADVQAAARRAAEMKVAKQLASDRAKAVKRAHRAKDKAAAAANAARQAETKALASADIEKEWLERTPGAREVGA